MAMTRNKLISRCKQLENDPQTEYWEKYELESILWRLEHPHTADRPLKQTKAWLRDLRKRMTPKGRDAYRKAHAHNEYAVMAGTA